MKAIRVNADYESVLFQNRPQPLVNEALESLALFLSDSPVITSKKYSEAFLTYVEEKTGRRPQLKREGPSVNWWGPLQNIDLERKLNSKEMSAELCISEGWCQDTYLISKIEELPSLKGKTYLAKNPFGMSGQNFCRVEEGRLENLERMLAQGKVVIEPLFDRVYDFSHYVFPNGVTIAYENLVDHKFQYRGTKFTDFTHPTVRNLPFYSEIDEREWREFEERLKTIVRTYTFPERESGFSVDSFVYRENGSLKIRALSEVNYRRTMGQTAFDLSLKFGGLRKWNQLLLRKSANEDFGNLRERLRDIEWREDTSRGVLVLSPSGGRFDLYFLSALDANEGDLLHKELIERIGS